MDRDIPDTELGGGQDQVVIVRNLDPDRQDQVNNLMKLLLLL